MTREHLKDRSAAAAAAVRDDLMRAFRAGSPELIAELLLTLNSTEGMIVGGDHDGVAVWIVGDELRTFTQCTAPDCHTYSEGAFRWTGDTIEEIRHDATSFRWTDEAVEVVR